MHLTIRCFSFFSTGDVIRVSARVCARRYLAKGPSRAAHPRPYPEVSVSMAWQRIGDAATAAVGAAAGVVADPRAGLQRVRAGLPAPVLVAAALVLVAGILLGRRLRS